jgi:hypothetical protein
VDDGPVVGGAQVGRVRTQAAEGLAQSACDVVGASHSAKGLAPVGGWNHRRRSMPPSPSELEKTFQALRGLLRRYQPPLMPKVNKPGHFDLWSNKDVVIDGRKRTEVYFAGVIIQKAYVGLYYMPVYTTPEMKRLFAPELLSLLKGKSCFHIKTLDARLLAQVKRALEAGFKLYKENGWV